MSEEEVIKQLKEACIFDENCYEVDCLYEKDLIAIRGLYDLYNKEKEKNKILFDKNAHWKASYFKLSRKIDVISKDKIKEKIKEVDKDINWNNADDHYYCINILKNLLGE